MAHVLHDSSLLVNAVFFGLARAKSVGRMPLVSTERWNMQRSTSESEGDALQH